MKNNLTFRDAISIVAPDKLAWYDAQDKDTKFQKECIALLDIKPEEKNIIPIDNNYFKEENKNES
tara:strand:- start:399 stop:593 length:195 start_codon:yes stop_codon:yes gene_type:complete